MVLLCDGRLVCGCADPYGKRVLGDARQESVSAVWTGARVPRVTTYSGLPVASHVMMFCAALRRNSFSESTE